MSDFDARLRVVPEFRPDEYEHVRDLVLRKLARRLQRWEPDQVELELSVKDRDTDKQRTVLEAWLPKVPKLVATSRERNLDTATIEVRDDLWRQLDKFLTKKESSRRR